MLMQAAADTLGSGGIAMLVNNSDSYTCIQFLNIRLNLLARLFS